MDFNQYQEKSRETWIHKESAEIRAVLGLVGEAGEVAEKYKKCLRGDFPGHEGSFVFMHEIEKELGDVLYYITRLADYSGLSLEEIAQNNINKINSRKDRNKIKGSGDHR